MAYYFLLRVTVSLKNVTAKILMFFDTIEFSLLEMFSFLFKQLHNYSLGGGEKSSIFHAANPPFQTVTLTPGISALLS